MQRDHRQETPGFSRGEDVIPLDRQALVARHLHCGNVAAATVADYTLKDDGPVLYTDLPASTLTVEVVAQGDDLGPWCRCHRQQHDRKDNR